MLLSFSRSSSFSRNCYLYYLIMFCSSAVDLLLFEDSLAIVDLLKGDLVGEDLGLTFKLLNVIDLVGDYSIAKSKVFS